MGERASRRTTSRSARKPGASSVQKGSAASNAREGIWDGLPLARDEFMVRVREKGAAHYRDLPWRNIDDAYAVLVSEVMLQQTQVARVLNYWERFLRAFPTVDALAAAATSDVLQLWQGLGYNRRALALKRAAEECSRTYEGRLPRDYDDLVALPGIGPATAAGVRAFAFRLPGVYLETNVRTVFLHELFVGREGVADRELIPLVADACPSEDARAWYYALLDYGAALKAEGANASRRSAHYARQSTFEGSRRQKRAWIVRYVLAAEEGVAQAQVLAALNEAELRAKRDAVDEGLFASIIDDLVEEGFFEREGSSLRPA